MDLSMRDMTELLGVNGEKVEEMIRDRRLPAHRRGAEYRFNRSEVKSWCLEHNVPVTRKIIDIDLTESGVSLTTLIGRGGWFYGVPGATASEVIKNAVGYMTLPVEVTRERLALTLLAREELMTTAIGGGIALPHPREPLITDPMHQQVAICFPKTPIDFKALDHEPVHTLFVILSADAHRHLEILSRISFLCRSADFVALLRERAAMESVMDHIMLREMEWNEKPPA